MSNPILSYRCLSELNWLGSTKTEQYLTNLENENTIISKLTLLYYWEIRGYSPKLKSLLEDKVLIDFILPIKSFTDIEEEISDRLFAFENYISELYGKTMENGINKSKFESIAKDYFIAYVKVLNEEAEVEHQNFLTQFRED